jgi:hypothetical protein
MATVSRQHTSTMVMAPSGNQGGINMWPSESAASRTYDIANIALILSLAMGVVSTLTIVWMGNVKESYLRVALSNATERAADANKAAAEANQAAAEADKQAKEADVKRLKLEEKLAPRNLTDEQQARIVEKMRPFAPDLAHRWRVAVFSYPPSAEADRLTRQLLNVFVLAGWEVNEYPVTYHSGPSSIYGVGVLTGTQPQSIEAARAVIAALDAVRLSRSLYTITRWAA